MTTKPFTIGILTSGGDAPGMNAAIRAVIRTALSNNMEAVGVINGFEGLINGEFRPMGARASIDNDIWGSNITIGTDTAMNTIMDAVDKLRDTASSHQRAFLIETMGRNCGYLAVMAGIVCGAEMVLIPEVPATADEVVSAVEDAYKRGKNHAIIIIAEGSALRTIDIAAKIDKMDVGFKTR